MAANTANRKVLSVAGLFFTRILDRLDVGDELFYFSYGDLGELEARGPGGHHGIGGMVGASGGGGGMGMGGGRGGMGYRRRDEEEFWARSVVFARTSD